MHGWGMNKTHDMEIHDIGVMNKLSKVIALNGTDRELLVGKGLKEEKVQVIPNGIYDTPSQIKKEPKKFKNKFNILCVGDIGRKEESMCACRGINIII